MLPEVSIVITAHNRADLLAETLNTFATQNVAPLYEVIVVDDGNDHTDCVCEAWGISKYFKTNRPPTQHYSNPSLPNNIGIKKAFGDLLIIQNAECRHEGPVIKQFLERTKPGTAVFAAVEALTPQGNHQMWYTHSSNPRPFFFCGAIHRDLLAGIRGFDEDYLFYGYDDNDMADRLKRMGIKFIFDDSITVKHQWHPTSFKPEDSEKNAVNGRIYLEKSEQFRLGQLGVVRNLDREWGEWKRNVE
jgi:GT2 family glycosyltransferase